MHIFLKQNDEIRHGNIPGLEVLFRQIGYIVKVKGKTLKRIGDFGSQNCKTGVVFCYVFQDNAGRPFGGAGVRAGGHQTNTWVQVSR